jgi:hypothetical protein
MDEREIEKGYADFHPGQAGKLSGCLGLSDELAEIEMYRTILIRSPLKDLHTKAQDWLKARGIEPPAPGPARRRKDRRAKRRS